MDKLRISPVFTLEDIHKIREYNYEMTKTMSTKEMSRYYKTNGDAVQKEIDEIREIRENLWAEELAEN